MTEHDGDKKERIKKLLGHGLSNEQVASAVGVSPSYISQLISDEEFANSVSVLRTAALTAATERDKSIDGLEDRILKQLSDSIDNNGFYKPKDLLHAAAVINNMKRRGTAGVNAGAVKAPIVELNMPVTFIQQFVTTPKHEVVEIGGKTLVPMTAGTLLNILADKKGNENGPDYEKVRNYLPTSGLKDVGENHKPTGGTFKKDGWLKGAGNVT